MRINMASITVIALIAVFGTSHAGWRLAYQLPSDDLSWGISAPDATHVYVAGMSDSPPCNMGCVMGTRDGESWNFDESYSANHMIMQCDFVNENLGYACGTETIILKYEGEGQEDTPTATATDSTPPRILVAGYMHTRLTSRNGGTFTMMAVCRDPLMAVYGYVGLYFNHTYTGVDLALVDPTSLVYSFPETNLGAGLGSDRLILGLKAHRSLYTSAEWPWLEVPE